MLTLRREAMANYPWESESVTGDLFNGPPDSDSFCTNGDVGGYGLDFCGDHEWTDSNNIVPITYKGLPGRRYGYMGKPPKEFMENNYGNHVNLDGEPVGEFIQFFCPPPVVITSCFL